MLLESNPQTQSFVRLSGRNAHTLGRFHQGFAIDADYVAIRIDRRPPELPGFFFLHKHFRRPSRYVQYWLPAENAYAEQLGGEEL